MSWVFVFIPNNWQLVLLTAVGRYRSCVIVNESWHVIPTDEQFLPKIRIETHRYNRWLKQTLLQTCTSKLTVLLNYVFLMCTFF